RADELGFDIFYVNGHTEKMMIPHLRYKDKTIAFAADLLPTAGHAPIPYVMGYDTRPLLTMPEKKAFLERALADDFYIMFEHDAHNEIAKVAQTERGIRISETFTCEEIFG